MSVLRTVRRRRGREQAALAAPLHAGAVADRDAGRLSPALAAGERALKIVEHGPGEFSPDAAVVWNTIGTIRAVNRDRGGIEELEQSLAVSLEENQAENIIRGYKNLASMLFSFGELERLGFEIESFGGTTIKVTAVPALLTADDQSKALLALAEDLEGLDRGAHVQDALQRIAATTAS